MAEHSPGLHHVTAIATDPQRNADFYRHGLGLRMVKQTVNFDAPDVYHLYYGDETGHPGTILTFFPWPGGPSGRRGTGQGGPGALVDVGPLTGVTGGADGCGHGPPLVAWLAVTAPTALDAYRAMLRPHMAYGRFPRAVTECGQHFRHRQRTQLFRVTSAVHFDCRLHTVSLHARRCRVAWVTVQRSGPKS